MWLAPLPIVIPLLAAALLAGLNRLLPRRAADAIAIATTIVVLGLTLTLLALAQSGPLVYWLGGWQPRQGVALGISLAIDPLGAGAAALASLLVLCALLYSVPYFDSVGTLFHVLTLAFLGAMCGFSLTGDAFNLFVFFELMSAAAFALCGYKVEETGPLAGALNFAITNTVGAFLALSGVALLYGRTGALNLAQIGRALHGPPDGLLIVALALLLGGFLTKAAMVPFHFWLADAHAVAPTPVCILFSGIMVELGLYGVARLYFSVFAGPFAAEEAALRALLVAGGTLTAIVGAVMCFSQRHLKRLLAFSTISHMGLMMIGFGLLDAQALGGAALYALGHGAVKGALFLLAGILLHRFGSVDELELHGRGRGMRLIGTAFVIGALGLAGLPPFGTFRGEAAMEAAAGRLGYDWVAALFVFVAALTAGAVLRAGGRIFAGLGWAAGGPGGPRLPEGRETGAGYRHVPPGMWLTATLLLALGLGLGVWPGLARGAGHAAAMMMDQSEYQARVLSGTQAHASAPPPAESPGEAIPRALLGGIGALGLAALALRPARRGMQARLEQALAAPLRTLRRLHSGHIADYIAFLTAGVTALGALLALLLR